jgi:ADP-ribose pyrophosphatase YjhB (NUDIX family)
MEAPLALAFMTSRPVTFARFLLYGTFYRLPVHWRRRLVRLGSTKFIVGAVVLVQDSGDKHLVMLRQPPGRGWSLPAGLLKRGERPEVGAARELYEETGIRLDPGELVPAQPSAIVHIHGRWVDVVFRARLPERVPLTADGAEVLEAAWCRLDELPPLTRATAYLLGQYGIGPQAGPGKAEPGKAGAR